MDAQVAANWNMDVPLDATNDAGWRDDRCIPTFCPCAGVIQSSGPLRHGIVDGLDVREARVHNFPPQWNAAPGQGLLVIRRNHETGPPGLARRLALGSYSVLVQRAAPGGRPYIVLPVSDTLARITNEAKQVRGH